MRLRRIGLLVSVSLALAGCGGSDGPRADRPETADPAAANAERPAGKMLPKMEKIKTGSTQDL